MKSFWDAIVTLLLGALVISMLFSLLKPYIGLAFVVIFIVGGVGLLIRKYREW